MTQSKMTISFLLKLIFLVFSKKNKGLGLVKKFDQALIALKQDGTYQKIIDKYLLSSNRKL